MDQSTISPNPIVFFASFLLFLSYIYNKIIQPRYKSFEKDHKHEKYSLEDHYFANPPQVYTTRAQERSPYYFEEAYNRDLRGPSTFSNNIQPTRKEFGNSYVPYRPLVNTQNTQQQNTEESISYYDHGWDSKEPDFTLPDVSVIHAPSRNKGGALSPNNSSFDQLFFEPKNGQKEEYFRAESRTNMSVEIPSKGTKPSEKKKSSPIKVVHTRGPVYDSSESESERGKEDAMEIIAEKGNKDKRGYGQFQNNGKDSSSVLDQLNESDYEPGVTKKRQEHRIGANIPNGKKVEARNNGVKVKEIFDYPSKPSNKKRSKDKDVDTGKSTKPKEDDSKKKGRSGHRTREEDPKDVLNRSVDLDASYMSEYSNQSLKKYVAKKIVQEQAFRGKDTVSAGDMKTMIGGAMSGGITSLITSGTTTQTTQKPATSGTSGLFGPGDSSSTQKSGLFSNTATKSGDEATTDKSQTGGEPEKKGLFSNLGSGAQDKKPAGDAPKATGNISQSLFGNNNTSTSASTGGASATTTTSSSTTSKLFGPGPEAGAGAGTGTGTGLNKTSSLFGNEAGITKAPTNQVPTEEPKLFKADSVAQLQPAATQSQPTENKGLPRIQSTSDLLQASQTAPPQLTASKPGLFSNLSPTKPTEEKKPEQPQAPKASLFSNLSAPVTENKPPAATSENQEKKPLIGGGGLFASLGATQTSMGQSSNTETKPTSTSSLFMPSQGIAKQTTTPAQNEPKKDEQKPSMFAGGIGGGGSSISSNLFGAGDSGKKPSPPRTPAPSSSQGQGQENTNNASPSGNLFGGMMKPSNQSPAQGSSGLMGGMGGMGGGASNSIFSNNTPSGDSGNKPAAPAGGIFANFKSSMENSPTKQQGGMGGGIGSGGLFGNSGSAGNAGNAGSGGIFGKQTTSDKVGETGMSGNGLFGNLNAGNNTNKSGGIFSNNANNNAGASGSSGLFGNMQGTSASSLFGNKGNTGNVPQSSITTSLFGSGK